MSPARPAAGPGDITATSLLRTLARTLDCRLVVLVPRTRGARSLWISEAGENAEIARLTAAGRAWLAEHPTGTVVAPGAEVAADHPDVVLVGVASAGSTAPAPSDRAGTVAPTAGVTPGAIVGVVVADRHGRTPWSVTERATARFAVDHHGPFLARAAGRPSPVTTLGGATASGAIDLRARLGAASGRRGPLHVVYQPEVDLDTAEVVAMEALLRWRHPVRGELTPDSFLGVAEQSDLIKAVDAWVLGEALQAFRVWTTDQPDLDVDLRLNVSPVQIADPRFPALVTAALAEHGIPAGRLCLEITEHLRLEDADPVRDGVQKLHELGVSTAMDDLAAGHSSLGRLRALPVDVVKIDRSLVAGIDADHRAQVIVGALAGLADSLGVALVAEGVERAEEADTLVTLGCRRAQGHYFGRPVEERVMARILLERGRRRPDEDRP